jgi:hypothetical protein
MVGTAKAYPENRSRYTDAQTPYLYIACSATLYLHHRNTTTSTWQGVLSRKWHEERRKKSEAVVVDCPLTACQEDPKAQKSTDLIKRPMI